MGRGERKLEYWNDGMMEEMMEEWMRNSCGLQVAGLKLRNEGYGLQVNPLRLATYGFR
jgi:hypothetical protein